MVDIMDMEDIFYDLIKERFLCRMEPARLLAIRICKEVEDFVEAQQTIACNNCKGKKFKVMKEMWQVL